MAVPSKITHPLFPFGSVDVMGSWNLLAGRRKDKAKNHAVPILEPDTAQHSKNPEAAPVTVQKYSTNILSFPDEILILIMHQLPYGTLYILRQTCRTFHDLASDFVFDPVLREPMIFMATRQSPERLALTAQTHLEAIRRQFTRQSLCQECLPVFDDEEGFIKKLIKLYNPRWCRKCTTSHPRFFFAGRWGRTCMGQKGQLALCDHFGLKAVYGRSNVRDCITMWFRSVGTKQKWLDVSGLKLECPKGCHVVYLGRDYGYKNMPLIRSINTVTMLKINSSQHTDKGKLQTALRERLTELDHLCLHASNQFDAMVDKIADTSCDFFAPGHELNSFPFIELLNDTAPCTNHSYDCRRCCSSYTWKRVEDRIILDIRIHCSSRMPISLDWLTNLRYRHERDSILNRKRTKGILWCDDPDCATGSGHRWRNMIQLFHQDGLSYDHAKDLHQNDRLVGMPELRAQRMVRHPYMWKRSKHLLIDAIEFSRY